MNIYAAMFLPAKYFLALACAMLIPTNLSADNNLTKSTANEISVNAQNCDRRKSFSQQIMPNNHSYSIEYSKLENCPTPDSSIIDITSVILTVIAVIIALITFLLTTAIPLLLKFYQHYTSHINEVEYAFSIIKYTNSILNWFDFVTSDPAYKNSLRIALDGLTHPESDSQDRQYACEMLTQLLSSGNHRWQEELRNLLCFMIFCKKIPKEVRNHIGWQTLDKKLEEYGVTGKLPEFSAPQNFRKRVFAAQDLILFFIFFTTLVGLLLVVIFKVS